MACESIAPTFTWTYLDGSWTPSADDPTPMKVLDPGGTKTGEDDPYKKILGFNATLGMGTSTSTLSIELSGFHLDAEEVVGRCTIFRCDQFGFGGIIKSVIHKEGRNGQTTKVEMNDLKELLAGYDVFLNEWNQSTDVLRKLGTSFTSRTRTQWNSRNIHREIQEDSYGNSIYTTEGGDVLESGDYADKLPDMSTNCFPFGLETQGKVAQGSTTYYQALVGLCERRINLFGSNFWPLRLWFGIIRDVAAEIPYVGTSAKNMTLLDLVNNVCEEAGYDWTFSTPNGANAVDIRLVDKKVKPAFGVIKNRIATAKNNNKLVDYSVGAEYKNEKTRKVVTGSKVNYIKEMYFDSKDINGGQLTLPAYSRIGETDVEHEMYPVLGFNNIGFPIYPSQIYGWTNSINTSSLSRSLGATGFGGLSTTLQTKDTEFCNLSTLAQWKLYGIMEPNSISRALLNFLGINWSQGRNKIDEANTMIDKAHACVEAVKFTTKKSVGELIYDELCYPWMRNFSDTYYGKYWICYLPARFCYHDATNFTQNNDIFLGQGAGAFMSDEPTDSGWADKYPVLGLNNPNLFKDGSGKITCFVGAAANAAANRTMPGGLGANYKFDVSSLPGDYLVNNGNIFTKAEVDGRVFLDKSNKMGILIKLPNMLPMKYFSQTGNANNMGLRAIELLLSPNTVKGYPQFGGTTDYSFLNVFKESMGALAFDSIAIPMKSNVVNYGPWLSHARRAKAQDGGTEFKHIDELNPWQYGGYDNMNAAGRRVADDAIRDRTRYESGQVTIAETPKYNMEGGGLSRQDPMIANIAVKFDASGGAVTTYNYQTYVQKFGQSAEAFNAYIKKGVSERQAIQTRLKDQQLDIQRAFAEGMRAFGTVRDKFFEQAAQPLSVSSASLNSVIYCSYPDGGNDRIEAGIDKKYSSDYFQESDNYSKYAIVSLDMIFSPVLANPAGGGAAMPPITTPLGQIMNYPPNATKMRIPPMSTKEIIPIGAASLNPYTTSAMMGNFGGHGGGNGFKCEYVSFGNDPANTYQMSGGQGGGSSRDGASDIRAAALRGPLLLHSWGYDINGKCVPGGESFNSGWMGNPKSWPCGPIDLRWDPARAVWVSPPSASLVIGTLTTDLKPGGSAQVGVRNIPGFYNTTAGGTITVYDFIGEGIPAGNHVVCYHFGAGADYIVLNHSDNFVKGDAGGCEDSGGVGQKIEQQDGYLWGFGPEGRPALYSIEELFKQPNLGGGGTKVLGYESVNKWGFPCMIDIPVVDCSGTTQGGGGTIPDGPDNPECPPGFCWSAELGRCHTCS